MGTQVVLTALSGDLAGRSFVFQRPTPWVVGRSSDCGLRLRGDVSVSRQHCLLDIDGQAVRVQDLGSLNGTHVNGENIARGAPRDEGPAATLQLPPPRVLQDGDELRVGRQVFRVEMVELPSLPGAATSPASAPEAGACR
jgi:pSer/pThr/pTyr-binding forkhead associated (FHA) protein